MKQLEHICCPLCNSKDYISLFTGKDFLFSQEEFTIVRCKSCGLLFTNPRVKEDQISYYYFSDYLPYKKAKQSTIFQKTKNRLGCVFGNPHWQILQTLQSIKAKAVLEIGPGSGNLLYFLKEHGLEVVGIEIDGNCVKKIREKGIPCYLGDLNDCKDKIGSKKFDAIILYHVFEHLYNPFGTLKNIHKLLNENGIVYLSIPNSGSIEAKLFGKYWKGLDLPRHIIHYDVNSIKRILLETNFKIIKLENESFPSSFVESIGFLLFKRGMSSKMYYLLYYPWKLLGPIHTKVIGSSVMKIIAGKLGKNIT